MAQVQNSRLIMEKTALTGDLQSLLLEEEEQTNRATGKFTSSLTQRAHMFAQKIGNRKGPILTAGK